VHRFDQVPVEAGFDRALPVLIEAVARHRDEEPAVTGLPGNSRTMPAPRRG